MLSNCHNTCLIHTFIYREEDIVGLLLKRTTYQLIIDHLLLLTTPSFVFFVEKIRVPINL